MFFVSASLKLRTIINELAEVKPKAHDIGIQLGVPLAKIVAFKGEGDLLTSVIDYWLRGNVSDVPVSWWFIVEALESKSVDESGCARRIREKYCQNVNSEGDEGNVRSCYDIAFKTHHMVVLEM